MVIKREKKANAKQVKTAKSKSKAKPKVIKYDKLCYKCKKGISERSKYVALITYQDGKVRQEIFMHFSCWELYFRDCVAKKTKEIFAKFTDNPFFNQAMKLLRV